MESVSTTLQPRTQRRLVSIATAANYLDVCQKTIRRRISDGTLTGYRLGRRSIRIDLDEVDSMLTPIPTAGGGDHVAP